MSNISKYVRAHVWILALALLVSASACGKGSGKNPKIDGVTGPNVNFIDNKFTLSMTLQNVTFDGGLRIPVPKMPSSYVEFGPDFQSNGLLISIGVDAKDLLALTGNPANVLDPTRLPGGRPLPGVGSGELPGLAVQVPKLENIAFYVGSNVFGVFVPVQLPWKDYMGSFRFYDGAGNRIGNLTIVGQDGDGLNSGILLLINLSGNVAKMAGLR